MLQSHFATLLGCSWSSEGMCVSHCSWMAVSHILHSSFRWLQHMWLIKCQLTLKWERHNLAAQRSHPAYPPLWVGLQNTCSKSFAEGLSVHLSLGLVQTAQQPTQAVWQFPAHPCVERLQDEEGISWLSEFFHQVNELIQLVQRAPADTKDGVGEGMTPFPEHWLKSMLEFQDMSAHASGEHSMCPVWKLRHQENVGDQLVKGCHYYLKCS